MKLKTLKDIEEVGAEAHKISGTCYKKQLRQEAIKWIKMLEKRISKGIAYDFEKSKIEWKAQIKILRIFSNITEEDLK